MNDHSRHWCCIHLRLELLLMSVPGNPKQELQQLFSWLVATFHHLVSSDTDMCTETRQSQISWCTCRIQNHLRRTWRQHGWATDTGTFSPPGQDLLLSLGRFVWGVLPSPSPRLLSGLSERRSILLGGVWSEELWSLSWRCSLAEWLLDWYLRVCEWSEEPWYETPFTEP